MTNQPPEKPETVPEREETSGAHYRCLMVTTGREEYVIRLMNAIHLGRGLAPRKVRIRHIRGEWVQDEAPMLPGYVFIREEEPIPIWEYQQLQDVIRVLRYDQEPEGYMQARDMRFARTLFRAEGMVAPLQAVDEGDFIRITDGMLKDMNGTVLSVDRHKRQAKIRLELMVIPKVIYMSYVLLEKKEGSPGTEDNPFRSQGEKGENGA